MRLVSLECEGFRCLQDLRFNPGEQVNIIRGKNAQGKTSILEAILFAATSKSHRTNTESELVCHGKNRFRIGIEADRADRRVRLEANWYKGAKRFKVNGVTQTKVSEILGRISVVFFTPEDISLIKGGAAVRRRFLDMELSQLSPAYLVALQQYRQILRQRNELLRTRNATGDQLDPWDDQLARYGAVLVEERAGFVKDLSAFAREAYGAIATDEPISVEYEPDIDDPSAIRACFEGARDTDLRRGLTTRGPHRDDVRIQVEGQPARNYGSQGQQKTAALALRLALVQVIHGLAGEYPILMMDEVLAELDYERASNLFKAIPGDVQCIVTTTELDKKHEVGQRGCTEFIVENGQLNPIE